MLSCRSPARTLHAERAFGTGIGCPCSALESLPHQAAELHRSLWYCLANGHGPSRGAGGQSSRVGFALMMLLPEVRHAARMQAAGMYETLRILAV